MDVSRPDLQRSTAGLLTRLVNQVESVIIGKRDVVEKSVVALLARGHLMVSDVPGVGKTTLAATLARSVGGRFHRIQFTNDLLPSDLLGVSVFDPATREFTFRPGPIFGNVVLADEINRTTPKTHSALLEAMGDGQVTIDGQTHALPRPFMVMATLNPMEFAGTFLLPESQLDRFLLRISMGYPGPADEKQLLAGKNPAARVPEIQPVMTLDQVMEIQRLAEEVFVSEPVIDYLLSLVTRTREDSRIGLGISPRGALALKDAARALALVRGRAHVLPDDIKELAAATFAHRLVISARAGHRSQDLKVAEAILGEILAELPVPL